MPADSRAPSTDMGLLIRAMLNHERREYIEVARRIDQNPNDFHELTVMVAALEIAVCEFFGDNSNPDDVSNLASSVYDMVKDRPLTFGRDDIATLYLAALKLPSPDLKSISAKNMFEIAWITLAILSRSLGWGPTEIDELILRSERDAVNRGQRRPGE